MFNSWMFKRLEQVVKSGSFSKAADAIYITRSALVQQVKAAEEDLGFVIFERSTKGISLTPAGKIFMEEGKKIFSDYENLFQKCRNIAKQEQNIITIGVMPNLKSISMLALCKEYRKEYPNAKITFKEYLPENYFAAFKAGEFDICCEYMSCYHYQDTDIRFLQLRPSRYCLEVPPEDELSQKKNISFTDLRGRKLMMYKRGITKCDDKLRDYILANEPTIELIDIDNYDSSLIIRCELEHAVLLSYARYDNSFPNFIPIDTDWDFIIERGIGYHKNCSAAVKNFLFEAIKLIDKENL